jgi:hypothetical protein
LKKAKKDKKRREKEQAKRDGLRGLDRLQREDSKLEEGNEDIVLDKMELMSDSPIKNELDLSSEDEDDQELEMEIDAPEEDF